jgi:EmrB/QacA subfamily drug resistance transporter
MQAVDTRISLATAKGRLVLFTLCAVAFLDFVDASITNVALPHIRNALGFSIQGLQWVPSGYLLTYGSFMLLGGRLADLFGRRRVLIVGTLLVGLSSLVGGFAGNAAVFVGARLAQGLGAALMLPSALSILTTTFTAAKDRRAALGVWGAVAGLSSAAGILLGGVLTEGPGWRWVMFVNPIACLLIVPAVLVVLPVSRPRGLRCGFDVLGGALLTGAMLLLVFALVKAPDQGWDDLKTWLELAAAAILLTAFVLNERRVGKPILPLDIFKVRGLAAANITGLIGFGGMLAMFFFLTLYMQYVLRYSPVAAGAAYLPLTFGVGISSGVGAKLMEKVGSRAIVSVGGIIAAAGLFLLARVPVGGSYVSDILPGILLMSLGIGPVFVGVSSAANAGVPHDRAGLAAAIMTSSQQVGGALGLAILSAIGTYRTAHVLAAGAAVDAASASGIRWALFVGGLFALCSAIVALGIANTHEEADAAGVQDQPDEGHLSISTPRVPEPQPR